MAWDWFDGVRGGGGSGGGRGGSLDDAIDQWINSQNDDEEENPLANWGSRTDNVVGDPSTFLNGSPLGGMKAASFYSVQDVLGPAGSWTGWNAQRRVQLQLAMQAAGLLDEIDNLGVWTSASQRAFQTLLEYANQTGMTWQDALTQFQQGAEMSAQAGFGGSGSLAPNVIQLPNEEDLDAALEETGMSLTGERLDDDLRSSATQAILDTLRTQQERQLQRELSASPGSTVFTESAPDVGRLLEEEIEERAPQKVMNKAARDAMDVWFALIGEQG